MQVSAHHVSSGALTGETVERFCNPEEQRRQTSRHGPHQVAVPQKRRDDVERLVVYSVLPLNGRHLPTAHAARPRLLNTSARGRCRGRGLTRLRVYAHPGEVFAAKAPSQRHKGFLQGDFDVTLIRSHGQSIDGTALQQDTGNRPVRVTAAVCGRGVCSLRLSTAGPAPDQLRVKHGYSGPARPGTLRAERWARGGSRHNSLPDSALLGSAV